MTLITVSEIQTHLSHYLNRTESLAEFKAWFDQETWGLAAETDSPVRRLAGEIELDFAELTSGELNEEEFRTLLRPLVPDDRDRQEVEMDYQIPLTSDEPVAATF